MESVFVEVSSKACVCGYGCGKGRVMVALVPVVEVVCGRGGGELPPVSGRAREGGAGAASGQESQKDRGEAEK